MNICPFANFWAIFFHFSDFFVILTPFFANIMRKLLLCIFFQVFATSALQNGFFIVKKPVFLVNTVILFVYVGKKQYLCAAFYRRTSTRAYTHTRWCIVESVKRSNMNEIVKYEQVKDKVIKNFDSFSENS